MRHNTNINPHTPTPHISSSKEIIHLLATNKLHFPTSYVHKVDATSSLQLHPHTHHIVTPGPLDRPRRRDGTAGQMDGEAGRWTTNGKIGLPPTLEKVMGVGRHQQGDFILVGKIIGLNIVQLLYG